MTANSSTPGNDAMPSRYRDAMAVARQSADPPAVVRRPDDLDAFFGKWVAVRDGKVIAAASSSRELAYELHKLGNRAHGAVMRYVAEPSPAVMVGLG